LRLERGGEQRIRERLRRSSWTSRPGGGASSLLPCLSLELLSVEQMRTD